ncbi:unnamed protein product, partial [Nippostrongylus brasiliensis]|uniref:DUF1758 domain-containing protein n=1 Tax=Nippostrongylus brasiliensis TaxID=27835 RepID=A0A0N4YY21_NIPBR
MDSGQGFQLSTSKRRLTLFCKKLDSTIAEAREVVSNFENQRVAQEKLTAVETFTKKVEEAQQEYATSLDRAERTPSAQEAVDYEQYLAMSEMTVLAAYEVAVQLRALLRMPSSTSKQRMLLDELHVVIAQLRDKGEQVDGQWLVKQVLAKFPQQVQREILRRKCSMKEPFSMQWLLDTLDKYISCEEKIAILTSNDKGKQPPGEERPAKGQSPRQIPACMYCNQLHKAANCTRYTTPQERANYLRQHKLCMICAAPQHSTEECKRRNCFTCQGRHHTSCCFKQKVTAADPEAMPTTRKEKQPSTAARSKPRSDSPRQVKQFTTQYHEEESSEQENEEDDVESIAEFHASKQLLGIGETFLPIGELTIMDPRTRKLRKISALLDSGAECSFIDQKLADELNLPEMSKTTLRVRTFGAPNDLECQTRKVSLDSIKRIVAFVLRFIHNTVIRRNAKKATQIKLSPLFDEAEPSYSPIPDGLEIKRATKMVAKQHQLAWITPTTQAALKHLNLYVDHEGILRCRGRLGKSAMSKEAKFPMLVLQKTWLSRLIIEDCHAKQHPGISHAMCK